MDNLKKRLNRKGKGFTLVELLVVITIIAILSVTAFVTLGGETVKARDSKRKQDLSLIQNALEIVFINETGYPDDPLAIGDGDGEIKKKYLSEVPRDPRDHDYEYGLKGSTYLMVATLENDGDPDNYEAYMIGNGEGDVFPGSTGILGNTCGAADTPCDLDGGGSCIPYCP